tara:strand:+ start:260 stop:649 length:390 start_codon:yes stop_codon:yes gene_type:complete
MKKNIFLFVCFLSLVVGLMGSSCSSAGTPKEPHPHKHKVEYSDSHLRLDDVRVFKNQGGLLVVDIDWNNKEKNGTPYRYRVFWKDVNGGVLSSADQSWRNVTMNYGHFPMRLTAKNDQAIDFRITIEKN